MAVITTGSDALMAVFRAREVLTRRNRQLQAGVSTHMTHLTGRGSKWHVIGSRRGDRKSNGRIGKCRRIGRTVTLGAIAAGRRGIGVNIGHRRFDRKVFVSCADIGMTSGTGRGGRGWNVVGWFARNREIDRATVALRTISGGRMGSVIDGVGAPPVDGTGMEAGITCTSDQAGRITRVFGHAHPGLGAFVARIAVVGDIGMNRTARRRRREKLGGPGRHAACIGTHQTGGHVGQMAHFTLRIDG